MRTAAAARAAVLLLLLIAAVPAAAQTIAPPAPTAPAFSAPLKLSLQSDADVESIYAPPETAGADEQQGANTGGVNFAFTFGGWTDYIYRGIDRSESGGSEDSPNLQFDGRMRFDLGRWPSLFVGVFTNVYDSDPISRFQEIRPYFGLDATIRPLKIAVGNTFYIFPERDEFNTAELWARLTVDDSYFFRTRDPVLSPYVLAAWDYDTYNGLYLEFGVRHDFAVEDTPLTISPVASVAYVSGNKMFRRPTGHVPDPAFDFAAGGTDSGFQHYEVGLETTYNLNGLLNIPARYGKLDFKGYLFYTDGLNNHLRADTELYGGIGIGFSY
jgi:hypothetical protein